MRPCVVITTSYSRALWPTKLRHYRAALQAAGAEVHILSPAEFAPHHPLVDRMQGLVLGGGGDVHPRRYYQPPNGTDMNSVDEARDHMEWALLHRALERDIPVLAICRGFQVLNVVLGGTLTQHRDGHQKTVTSPLLHKIHVVPGTRLWEALGYREQVEVNSHHHQVVLENDCSPRLRATAWTQEMPPVIEGLESPLHRWVVGVQWHPERMHEFPPHEQKAQASLFCHFVRAAAQVARPFAWR